MPASTFFVLWMHYMFVDTPTPAKVPGSISLQGGGGALSLAGIHLRKVIAATPSKNMSSPCSNAVLVLRRRCCALIVV